ncbi:MAG: nuclear transport factor 2 family protein [Candidatus Rokubacteria bacterium]|nr:nuclear transport factor 2 family protein [Candidatus Rokubacteria bacterium]
MRNTFKSSAAATRAHGSGARSSRRPRGVGVFVGLLLVGLAAGAGGQPREDFANVCAPLISLSTMTPPPGDAGEVVRALQTIAAGIAKGDADLIVSAYADTARVENFPSLLGARGPVALDRGRHPSMSKEELRRIYRAYFRDFPEAAIVFTRVNVSVQGAHATVSARARFVLPPGSGRDTHTATVVWRLARGGDGWRITEERYQE